jgi:hypothetical protein
MCSQGISQECTQVQIDIQRHTLNLDILSWK